MHLSTLNQHESKSACPIYIIDSTKRWLNVNCSGDSFYSFTATNGSCSSPSGRTPQILHFSKVNTELYVLSRPFSVE
jgi:hypothetical protein